MLKISFHIAKFGEVPRKHLLYVLCIFSQLFNGDYYDVYCFICVYSCCKITEDDILFHALKAEDENICVYHIICIKELCILYVFKLLSGDKRLFQLNWIIKVILSAGAPLIYLSNHWNIQIGICNIYSPRAPKYKNYSYLQKKRSF